VIKGRLREEKGSQVNRGGRGGNLNANNCLATIRNWTGNKNVGHRVRRGDVRQYKKAHIKIKTDRSAEERGRGRSWWSKVWKKLGQ